MLNDVQRHATHTSDSGRRRDTTWTRVCRRQFIEHLQIPPCILRRGMVQIHYASPHFDDSGRFSLMKKEALSPGSFCTHLLLIWKRKGQRVAMETTIGGTDTTSQLNRWMHHRTRENAPWLAFGVLARTPLTCILQCCLSPRCGFLLPRPCQSSLTDCLDSQQSFLASPIHILPTPAQYKAADLNQIHHPLG